MSYVRMGPDSDVYLIGTTGEQDAHVIECCGCILTCDMRKFPPGEEPQWVKDLPDWAQGCEWDFGPVQNFRSIEDALAHLQAHRDAGHKVPEDAFDAVRNDWWLAEREPEGSESQ